MDNELEKLRIDKSQKTRRERKSAWRWVILVVLLACAAAGVLKWRQDAAGQSVQTTHIPVAAGAASDASLVVLNATGYVTAAHKIQLASKVIGRVAWVGVEMGDKIAKDQVLVRLEDDEFKARVAQQQGTLENAQARLAELEAGSRPEEIAEALAGVDQAKAELANAESNLKRLKELDTSRIISRQETDDAETLVRSRQAFVEARQQRLNLIKAGTRKEQIAAQRATIRQLEGSLAQATIDLDNTIIHSPVDATVLTRNVEVGEFVTTGFVGDRGAKGYVLSIADLNDLRVELDVSQNDFAKVEPQQPCWITTDAYPDRKYDGVVDLISPEANRQKATVQVRVKVLKPDELLKPDMNATVSFLSKAKLAAARASSTVPGAQRPAIRVPVGAIRDGAVFVVESGLAIKRPNATSGEPAADGQIEIRKGLVGGEDVIVSLPETLKDGDKVRIEPIQN